MNINNKSTAKINNWFITYGYLGDHFLVGNVTEHSKQREFNPHAPQITSALVYLNTEEGIAETKNTYYSLGKHHETVQDQVQGALPTGSIRHS